MTACEQCWADASRDAQLLGGSVVDHYYRRIERDAVIKRAEAAEAAHKALTEAVRWLADAWEDDARPVAGRIVTDLRAILTEYGADR